MGSFSDSRIDKLTTGNYDMIVGLTQGHINDVLADMHERTPALQTLKKSNRLGSIDATLLAPQVMFDVTSGSNFVIYLLRFASGTMSLYDVNGSSE